MSVKLLTEHHLEYISLKGGCTGSSESTHVKMPHCWKAHVAAHMFSFQYYGYRERLKHLGREDEVEHLNRTALRIAREIADKSGKLMAGNLSNTPFYDPDDRKMDEKIMEMFKVFLRCIFINIIQINEPSDWMKFRFCDSIFGNIL